jgi:Ca2+-binding EF-hand superfamily protein
LLKAFKYFDLNNNGTVEPDEFAKAVEKIGIMIPTRQVSPILTQGRKYSPTLLFLHEGITFWLVAPTDTLRLTAQ